MHHHNLRQKLSTLRCPLVDVLLNNQIDVKDAWQMVMLYETDASLFICKGSSTTPESNSYCVNTWKIKPILVFFYDFCFYCCTLWSAYFSVNVWPSGFVGRGSGFGPDLVFKPVVNFAPALISEPFIPRLLQMCK